MFEVCNNINLSEFSLTKTQMISVTYNGCIAPNNEYRETACATACGADQQEGQI
jgi:hypothetical protein